MKYALISDIHGNLPALQTVLTDAEKQGVEQFLFLGDYIEDLPWPNEVVDTIRSLKSAVIIRGNKEDYLKNLRHEDRSGWIHEQFAPMYWNCRKLTPENYDYLVSLPSQAIIPAENGESIYLSHSSPVFYRRPRIEAFHSSSYLLKMKSSAFTHAEYIDYARRAVLEHPQAMGELAQYPNGVHAFGHNHLQWYMEIDGIYHVNPGSCGMPLGFEGKAPYIIIEQIANGWSITECNVSYDIEATIAMLRESELYAQAEIWSKVMIYQLRTGADYISFFIRYALALAEKRTGRAESPVSNEIWREAADTFDMIDLRKV